MSLTSHRCCVRLKILEQAQIFSASHTITPTGGCINRKAINNKNTLPRFTKLILTLYFSSDEMFFRFIALKSMGAL